MGTAVSLRNKTSVSDSPRAAALTRHANRKRYLRPTRNFLKSGEPEDNYTPRVPHEFWSLLAQEKVSGATQLLVIGYILARTWGDPEKHKSAAIPLSDFARELNCSIKAANIALLDLHVRKLILITDAHGHTDSAMAGQLRLYRATPKNWGEAPKYKPKAIPVDEADINDGETEDDDADVVPKKIVTAQRFVVSHGQRCRPLPIHFSVKGVEAPVRLQMNCDVSDSGLPALEINATSHEGGRFDVSVRRATVSAEGETKANNHGRGRPCSNRPLQDPSLNVFRHLVKYQLLTVYSHPFSDKILADVIKRAGTATFEQYEAKLKDRQERARRKGEKLDHTVLLWVADDVGAVARQRAELERDHQRVEDATAAHNANAAAESEKRFIASCREHALKDPADYERFLESRQALGEKNWPTFEQLGVAR